MAIFWGDNPYIDSWWKLFYNGRLSTTATLFCPQGGRCQDVQLYYVKRNLITMPYFF